MKRHAALTQFSSEHHAALVLAKRAQRTSEGAADAVHLFAAEVGRIFARDLEPHFQLEEELLLPALMTCGQRGAVERILAEHAELRSLVDQPGLARPERLRRFGEALAEHVRFEERELFPLAESALTEETLTAIQRGLEHRLIPTAESKA